MKPVLFTGYDDAYAGLARLTVPLIERYAVTAGMDFISYTSPPPGLNIYWTGLARGLELLRSGYRKIVYLDVDQVITNEFAMPWFDVGHSGFHASQALGGYVEPWDVCLGGFVAHQNCVGLFEDVLTMEPDWQDKPLQATAPFCARLKQMVAAQPRIALERTLTGYRICSLINVHGRRLFNAVPQDAFEFALQDPWQAGDWCAHLTRIPMEQRLDLFARVRPEIDRQPQYRKKYDHGT